MRDAPGWEVFLRGSPCACTPIILLLGGREGLEHPFAPLKGVGVTWLPYSDLLTASQLH